MPPDADALLELWAEGRALMKNIRSPNKRRNRYARLGLWAELLQMGSEQHKTNFQLKPGEILVRRKELAFRSGFSESTVRDFLGLLQRAGLIHIDPGVRSSKITILHWPDIPNKSALKDPAEERQRSLRDDWIK